MQWETRTINQFKVYALVLNNMRCSAEQKGIVVISDSREKIVNYYESMRTDYYTDSEGVPDSYGHAHPYQKCFQKGSPLEWYIPPHGSLDEAIIMELVNEETLASIERSYPIV